MKFPNCGKEFDYPRLCPNCGTPKRGEGSPAAAVVVAIFLVLPVGLVGTCSTVAGIEAMSSPNPAPIGIGILLTGLAAIALTIGGMIWVKNLWRG